MEAAAAGAEPWGDDLHGLGGGEKTLFLIEDGAREINATARGLVGVKELDGNPFPGDFPGVEQRHPAGLEDADELVVLIVAGDHHPLQLAAIRQKGDGGDLFSRQRDVPRRQAGGEKRDGCEDAVQDQCEAW